MLIWSARIFRTLDAGDILCDHPQHVLYNRLTPPIGSTQRVFTVLSLGSYGSIRKVKVSDGSDARRNSRVSHLIPKTNGASVFGNLLAFCSELQVISPWGYEGRVHRDSPTCGDFAGPTVGYCWL